MEQDFGYVREIAQCQPTCWTDFLLGALNERYRTPLDNWKTGPLWHATGMNGTVACFRSSRIWSVKVPRLSPVTKHIQKDLLALMYHLRQHKDKQTTVPNWPAESTVLSLQPHFSEPVFWNSSRLFRTNPALEQRTVTCSGYLQNTANSDVVKSLWNAPLIPRLPEF